METALGVQPLVVPRSFLNFLRGMETVDAPGATQKPVQLPKLP